MNIVTLYEKVLPDIAKEAIMSDDNGVLQRFNTMITKSQVLKVHTNSIWQGTGKDQRWKTTVANNKVIAKNSERELLEYLAKYYNISDNNCTLASLYPEWIEYKKLHARLSTTFTCIDSDWKRYYLGTDIVTVPINKLSKLYLDKWAHGLVRQYDLTGKQYYNATLIVRQILNYAVDKELIQANEFLKIKIEPKLFRVQRKPKSETQVFMIDELEQLKTAAYEDYGITHDTSSLGIIILSLTGMRVGEIVALKEYDIGDVYLHVERQEVKVEKHNDDGSWSRDGYIIADYTKSKAGTRDVYMSNEVRELFKEIKRHNLKNSLMNSEHYIFYNSKGERMHERSLSRKLNTLCNRIGIPFRSLHKLRKTYISKLIDEGVNINTVREMVGHADERITYNNYCFDRRSRTQIEEQMERILTSGAGCKYL